MHQKKAFGLTNAEVRFASLQSGRFITVIVVNPPERKLAKRTSVKCSNIMHWLKSASNQNISKIIFVLGSYEYLERLEGKIRKCLFF